MLQQDCMLHDMHQCFSEAQDASVYTAPVTVQPRSVLVTQHAEQSPSAKTVMKLFACRTSQTSTLHSCCPAKNKNLCAGLYSQAHCTAAVLPKPKICVQDFTAKHTAQLLSSQNQKSACRTLQPCTLHRCCQPKTKVCLQGFTEEHSAQMLSELPTRWEKLGDLALLPRTCLASPVWADLGQPLWRAIADALGVARLAMQAPVANTGWQSACVMPLQLSSRLPHLAQTSLPVGTNSQSGVHVIILAYRVSLDPVSQQEHTLKGAQVWSFLLTASCLVQLHSRNTLSSRHPGGVILCLHTGFSRPDNAV